VTALPAEDPGDAEPIPHPPFGEALRVWIRIALLSFGGPAGQIAVIHRVIVDEKRWVDEPRFIHALSYCMLLPGPEAQQLATYFGWLFHGTRGALIAGSLFVLPGVLAILALSYLYVIAGNTPLVTGLFFGLKPAVLAVVLVALGRIARRALLGAPSIVLAALAFIALFGFAIPFPLVIVGAGILGLLLNRSVAEAGNARPAGATRPSLLRMARTVFLAVLIWWVPPALVVLAVGPDHVLAAEARFFSKVAVVTFGGAYAVLAYVAQQAVEVYRWLTPAEMLDGLGLAESTPGPLIMVLQFVGFLGAFRSPGNLDPMVAGLWGSLITTWVTFVPSFGFILAGAPWVEYFAANRRLKAALTGIMAAVVGVVLNLSVWFGLHTLFAETRTVEAGPLSLLGPDLVTIQWWPVLIMLGAWFALTRFKVSLPLVLLSAAVLGIIFGQRT
jgi:chromate transporter